MTDKQIIIDDVDVSGCEFYNKDDKTCREINGNYDTDICEFDKCENSNCCYKQLKHKEQEVQQAMDNYVQLDLQRVKEYNKLVDLYKAKEQECEELKRLISKQKNAKIQLSKLKDKQYKEFCDMKQTLTEIKEIVEGMHDLWINKTPYTDMDNLIKHLLECELNRIRYKLDEISESKVNNENIRNI